MSGTPWPEKLIPQTKEEWEQDKKDYETFIRVLKKFGYRVEEGTSSMNWFTTHVKVKIAGDYHVGQDWNGWEDAPASAGFEFLFDFNTYRPIGNDQGILLNINKNYMKPIVERIEKRLEERQKNGFVQHWKKE